MKNAKQPSKLQKEIESLNYVINHGANRRKELEDEIKLLSKALAMMSTKFVEMDETCDELSKIVEELEQELFEKSKSVNKGA